jgi:hypothetical protein
MREKRDWSQLQQQQKKDEEMRFGFGQRGGLDGKDAGGRRIEVGLTEGQVKGKRRANEGQSGRQQRTMVGFVYGFQTTCKCAKNSFVLQKQRPKRRRRRYLFLYEGKARYFTEIGMGKVERRAKYNNWCNTAAAVKAGRDWTDRQREIKRETVDLESDD